MTTNRIKKLLKDAGDEYMRICSNETTFVEYLEKTLTEELKAERQRIIKMIEGKKKEGTLPEKPKRGRPYKYPRVTFKRIKIGADNYNQALEEIIKQI